MTTRSAPSLGDRAHAATIRVAQRLWLPIVEAIAARVYEWGLARSKRY